MAIVLIFINNRLSSENDIRESIEQSARIERAVKQDQALEDETIKQEQKVPSQAEVEALLAPLLDENGLKAVPLPSVSGDSETLNLTSEDIENYLLLLARIDPLQRDALLNNIITQWKPVYVPMIIETYHFIADPQTRQVLREELVSRTGEDFGGNIQAWYQWLWNQPEIKAKGYDNFKAELLKVIDPKFEAYFKDRGETSLIRLDEIRWGGVIQDGIPPLRNPEMIAANEADYLEDDNVVFGIEVNGDARAYPKRILAWHEMFVDTVGGIDFAGVYCTLCGTVILYETSVGGVDYEMGTSGFLYRSNKLMYDQATQSLWNTLLGEPVLGPLASQGIALPHRQVVTTTWGEWKKRHPETTVLSLDTGYRRDYGEGVAYQEYFATDELMFNTPFNDNRLDNKQEVLALRLPGNPKGQVAIDTDFLNNNPIYYDVMNEQAFVVLTDTSAANRAYERGGVTFESYDQNVTLVDDQGATWTQAETELVADNGDVLKAIPYHRAFWFGWQAAFPDTRLVK